MRVILFFGAPGAGKTTQAKLLSKSTGLPYVSTGELIRTLVHPSHPYYAHVCAGTLLPAQHVCSLVNEYMHRARDQGRAVWIMDGLPRQDDELAFVTVNFDVVAVIRLKCARKAELRRRILERRTLESREDECMHVLEKRLNLYYEMTEPIIQRFPEHLTLSLDACRPKRQIAKEISTFVQNRLD